MENIIKRRVNLLVVPFLALIVLLIFSFGVSAEEPLIKLVTKSGEEIPCYDELDSHSKRLLFSYV